MRGTACEKTEDEHGEIHYRSVPNSAVFRYLGIASSRVELRIRRLKFLQCLARDPANIIRSSPQFSGLCSLMVSQQDNQTVGCLPAKTYWEDVQALRCLDSAYWLVDLANGEVLPFFSEQAKNFMHVDVSELRAQELSVRIPPPGYVHHPALESEDTDEPQTLAHTCNMLLDSGQVCGQQFKCLRDLRLLQFRSKQSNHGVLDDSYKAAHVNQCPWCLMVHASIVSTRKHNKT